MDDELIQQLIDELGRRSYPSNMATAGGTVGESQKLRTMAQGLTLGGSDEIEAAVRSLMPGQNYGEALEFVRGKVDEYRKNNPGQAMGDEVLGALIPAAVGLFTGGGGTSASLGRMALRAGTVGGIEGGAYSFLSGTGGDAEDIGGQALNRARDVPFGVGVGAAAGPIGVAAGRGIGRGISGLIDHANRTLGPRVGKAAERELQRIVEESGLTMEEAAARIESGELLAEANKTLQTVARSYYAKDRGAGRVLSETYSTRPEQLRSETMDYLQKNMAGEGDPNVLRQFTMDDAARRKAQGAEYDQAFAGAGGIGDEATQQIADAVRRAPGAAKDLDELYRAKTGQKPFFRFDGDEVTFDRNPTAEEAEIIYRGLRDTASNRFRAGSGGVGEAIGDLAGGVKSIVDEAAPEVKNVRARWSQLETAKEAFDEGRKAFAQGPDAVAMAYEAAAAKGEGALKAYRAGVMDRFRRQSFTGSRKSMPRNIADENSKEGAILRIVFPGDNIEELVQKAGRAAKAQDASNQIIGGSQTAITQGRSGQIGEDMMGNALEAASGSTFAALRLATQVVKGMRPSLSSKDIEQVARLMVESDPDAFRKAAMGTGPTDMVVRVADDVLRRVEGQTGMAARRSAQPVQQQFFQ